MDSIEYEVMASQQINHWWYRGRRAIVKSSIEKFSTEGLDSILEVGCGTGGNLSMLATFGEVYAVEMDDFARQHAADISGVDVKSGWLPENLPFQNKQFDLICLFDVLEHIRDDLSALISLKERLNKNGKVMITVPAYKWMFGKHDINMHHYRRYNSGDIKNLLEKAGIEVDYFTHFNSLLYPIAAITRIFDSVTNRAGPIGGSLRSKFLNDKLYDVFQFEQKLLDYMEFPIGLSIMVVGRVK
ncbi:class I SAM-dependent methyltransferase [Shewanella sp. KX20019]|uniref:class I SAM-dependent methyltransferase n=1 Tax=Shewanella sp. KX20019 TaxID=2803864 RepID=UPI0019264DA1|nr:class I SAM-dependent methyltransferase [Shewanella sp. KX20019]QQX82296.1 class I SAM-dependent methyltransferase [Shewanella sp. KX20019]